MKGSGFFPSRYCSNFKFFSSYFWWSWILIFFFRKFLKILLFLTLLNITIVAGKMFITIPSKIHLSMQSDHSNLLISIVCQFFTFHLNIINFKPLNYQPICLNFERKEFVQGKNNDRLFVFYMHRFKIHVFRMNSFEFTGWMFKFWQIEKNITTCKSLNLWLN